ncbi:MAG: hypothetical protein M1337_01070 [Actinobacteria bacterium]|nr:hypothetical protein [Actinomycetota bacterium]
MARVQQFKYGYPEPATRPGGRSGPFLVALLLFAAVAVELSVIVDRWVDFPVEKPKVETRVYRAPAPIFSSDLAPSRASEDSAGFSNASDWAIGWNGRFFTQTNGQPDGASRQGFGVTDADEVEFWQAYINLGGRRVLGFPLSRRFTYDGRVVQVFQRAVFQWDPATKSVVFMNVIDELLAHGKEGWLMQEYKVPPALPQDFDKGKGWNEVIRGRLELLAVDGILLGAYYAVPDPVTLYGLPTSRVEDRGEYNIVQLQRAIVKHWKPNANDPMAGQVVFIGAGEIAKASGLFPADAFVPEDPPKVDQ